MMYLFGDKALEAEVKKLQEERGDLRNTTKKLEGDKDKLELEIEKLRLKKKMEEEDIKHMIKIRDEKFALEKERYEVKMQGDQEKAIAAVKDKYRDKMEQQLENETKTIKEMYGQILKRLPNVNVKMKGDV